MSAVLDGVLDEDRKSTGRVLKGGEERVARRS